MVDMNNGFIHREIVDVGVAYADPGRLGRKFNFIISADAVVGRRADQLLGRALRERCGGEFAFAGRANPRCLSLLKKGAIKREFPQDIKWNRQHRRKRN